MNLEDTNEREVKEGDHRWNFRDYLRATEIGAVVILAIVIAVGVAFRGSAPISVTVDNKKTAPIISPIVPIVPQENFVVTNLGETTGSAKENIATADPKIFKSPTNFKSFSYDASLGKKISLVGTCKDAYYVLLIFKSTDDYRKDPARSYYNTAYPCPATKMVAINVDLKEFNLPTGEYYLFLADQGNTGSWYNPR